MENDWIVEAKRDAFIVGGHLYIQVKDGNGNLYAQIHGYATTYYQQPDGSIKREVETSGLLGLPIGKERSKLEIWELNSRTSINKNDSNEGVELYRGSKEGILSALSKVHQLADFTKGQFLPYKAVPEGGLNVHDSSNPDVTINVDVYNSNSIFMAVVNTMKSVIPISDAALEQAINMGDLGILNPYGANPGVEQDILKDYQINLDNMAPAPTTSPVAHSSSAFPSSDASSVFEKLRGRVGGDGMFGGLMSAIPMAFGGGKSAPDAASTSVPIRSAAHPHRYQRAAGLDPAQLVRHELRQQRSTLDIDQILSDAVAKNADTLIDRLLAKNPNLFQKTLGRSLVSSVQRFAREIRKSKTRSVEEAFDTVFSGKSGAAFAANIGQQAANALVSHGIYEIFYRERTRTHRSETQRSQDTANQFRLSQSQKAADLIKTMKQGQRNV